MLFRSQNRRKQVLKVVRSSRTRFCRTLKKDFRCWSTLSPVSYTHLENFPIADTRNNFVLEFLDYYIDPPRYTIDDCIERGLTYSFKDTYFIDANFGYTGYTAAGVSGILPKLNGASIFSIFFNPALFPFFSNS